MQPPLSPEEINYLLVLATRMRRKREHERARMRPRPEQRPGDYERFLEAHDEQTAWVRSIEEHLCLLVAETDERLLRPSHRELLDKIRDEDDDEDGAYITGAERTR